MGGNFADKDTQFRKDQMDLLCIDDTIVYYLICVRRMKTDVLIPYKLVVLLYRVRA